MTEWIAAAVIALIVLWIVYKVYYFACVFIDSFGWKNFGAMLLWFGIPAAIFAVATVTVHYFIT